MMQTELELTTFPTAKWKRYPIYKDSGVEWLGEIPEHWEGWKISHAFRIVGSGTTPLTSHEEYYEGDIPWVNTAELRDNFITNTSKRLTSKALRDYPTLRVYHRGTLLVALYGATIGRIGILDISATTNQACCALSAFEYLDVNFTFYWFLAHRQHLTLLASGGGQPNISQDTIRSLKISAPSISEQHTIATFLDRETAKINTLIAQKERLIALLQEKRSALISHAVTKGLDGTVTMKDSGVEWLGEIPAHWEVLPLKRIAAIRYGLGQPPSEMEGAVPLVRATNVKNGTIVDEDMLYIDPVSVPQGRMAILSAWEIIVVRSGAYTGDSAIVPLKYEGAIAGYDMVVAVVKGHSQFIAWQLLSQEVRELQFGFYKLRAAQPHLNAEELGSTVFSIPPLSEQQAIAAYLDRETAKIDALISRIHEGIDKLKEYNAALIAAAVTGKIDVRGEYI